MKCDSCGHEASIYEFLDAHVESLRDEDGRLSDDADIGGLTCPECGNDPRSTKRVS